MKTINFASNPLSLGNTIYNSAKSAAVTTIDVPVNTTMTFEADSTNANMKKITFTPPSGLGDATVLYTVADHYKLDKFTDGDSAEITSGAKFETADTLAITANYSRAEVQLTFAHKIKGGSTLSSARVYDSSDEVTSL